MISLGRLMIFAGALLLIVGVLLVFAGRFNPPLGRLPGDLAYRGKNVTVFFPLATSIVISIILSLILWLVQRR